jgi:hypothetical protein
MSMHSSHRDFSEYVGSLSGCMCRHGLASIDTGRSEANEANEGSADVRCETKSVEKAHIVGWRVGTRAATTSFTVGCEGNG